MRRIKPILIGVVIFGALLVIARSLALEYVDHQARRAFLSVEVGGPQFEEVMDRVARLSPEDAVTELRDAQELFAGLSQQEREEYLGGLRAHLAKSNRTVALIFLVVTLLILILSSGYYLTLALSRTGDAFSCMRETLVRLVPLVGVYLWIIVRSFAWVPIAVVFLLPYTILPRMWLMVFRIPAVGQLVLFGVVVLVVFLTVLLATPVAFSPVLLLTERRGILGSVRESMRRTVGKRLELAKTLFSVLLVLWLASFAAKFLFGFIPPLESLLMGIFGQLQLAFAAYFLVVLSRGAPPVSSPRSGESPSPQSLGKPPA